VIGLAAPRTTTWLAMLLVAVALACRGADPAGLGSPPRIELTPLDADVWSPTISISTTLRGGSRPTRCELSHQGRLEPITPDITGFRRQLRLDLGENRVFVRCWDRTGRSGVSDTVRYVARSAVWQTSGDERVPPLWLDDAVLYGVVPPLYGSPPLRAVTLALPALAELGITALWLSPLMGTPPGDYGYAVVDYFAVRRDYGSEADLTALIERAHELGLKVLLDFVPNHTSEQHPYFRQARAFGRRSHYFDFFERTQSGASRHYFDWQHLPNLDYSNPEVGLWMSAAASHWLTRFGVDGFRIDAAWGIAQRSPEFYPAFSRRLAARSNPVLIAEASARDPYYLAHGFDATYDWTEELGHWAWGEVFAEPLGIATRLARALEQTASAAPRGDRVLRFLNNNDTGPRFITRHGLGLTRAATVLLLTVPGIPCLFAFDEVGGEFQPYERLSPLHGGAHPELRDLHRRLIELRHAQPALRGPGLTLLDSQHPEVSMYLRPASAGGASILVLLSWSERPTRLRLSARRAAIALPARLHDLLDAGPDRTLLDDEWRQELEPFGFRVWALLPISQ
jgi:cyclomaltodextrinase / maltogenic alpha-amylase / neopullulanase